MFFPVFPDMCDSFEGPHSRDCFDSIWSSSGCFESGFNRPANLTELELDAAVSLKLS